MVLLVPQQDKKKCEPQNKSEFAPKKNLKSTEESCNIFVTVSLYHQNTELQSRGTF